MCKDIDSYNDENIMELKLPEMVQCVHCHAEKFAGESKNLCCSNGQANLTPYSLPDEFMAPIRNSRKYLRYLRAMNAAFGISSVGGIKVDKKVNKGLQQTYRAAGSIHQAFGALHPDAGEDRKFAQLYMNDPTDQDDARDARFDCLKKKDIKLVRNLLETYNPYVQLFKLNRHTLNHNQEYKVVLKNVSKESYNRYQAPSVDEVGGILDEKTGHLPMQVVLEKKKLKNGKPKFSFAKHHHS